MVGVGPRDPLHKIACLGGSLKPLSFLWVGDLGIPQTQGTGRGAALLYKQMQIQRGATPPTGGVQRRVRTAPPCG